MRPLVGLFLLGVALALLHHFTASAPLAARAALALGVVTFLAELAGRVAARQRVPRVSGFVAAGLACGPAVLGLVRPDEVATLGFVADAALALFVLRAGLALDRPAAPLGPVGRYFTASLIIPFALTMGVVYALHRWFPLTVHQPRGDALAVALVLGALTVVAAPALTWTALVDAPGGVLAEALLRLNVLREFAAVGLFAAALAVARLVASAGAISPPAPVEPLIALGVSLLAGVLLAGLASWCLRLLDVDPGVCWVGLALSAAVTAWLGRGELALAALATGLVLSRLDGESAERLRRHFDARGTVLAAAAFALFGLRLDVASLGWADVWVWVLLLVAVRAVGLYWGDRVAGRGPLVAEALALGGRGWLGLISQGGVGVSLAAVGRRAFPEWGVSFEGLVVALVAVHAVVGPICLRWAVARRPILMEGTSGGT